MEYIEVAVSSCDLIKGLNLPY